MQERAYQQACDAAEFLGIFVGPVGMRPLTARLPQVKPGLIRAGVHLMIKSRVDALAATGRQRSPVEICAVRPNVVLPNARDYGEETLLPVEFFFCDA